MKWRLLFIFLVMTMLWLGIVIMTPEALAKMKVGLVTDMGKIDDKTFNEHAYKGLLRAAEAFNLSPAFIETQQPGDYLKNIEQFAREGYPAIITVGFMLGDATRIAARKHPGMKFIIVDFFYDPPVSNIQCLVFSENQAGFLAGALAGMMTQTNVIGIVAGKDIPPVIRFKTAYIAGVSHVCPDCEVLAVHIDSFSDPARGKTAALSQMDEGADVIFGAGGTTGSGAIMGAAQAGAWVIGVDQDEYLTTFKNGKVPGANRVLTSALKHIDVAVYDALKSIAIGTFQGGTRLFDITSNGIGLAPFHEASESIPSPVKTKLHEIEQLLKSGSIDP
jgi:basic membrane lipoprotein Med (substrate-binding protein (PBP1-ABC) superfamily)